MEGCHIPTDVSYLVSQIPKDSVMTNEQGFLLTVHFVNFYWYTDKFFTLKSYFERDDIIHDLYLKFLTQRLFEKYDGSITKFYHIKISVYRSLIDKVRTLKEVVSLNSPMGKEEGNETTLMDTLPSKEVMENKVMDNVYTDWFLSKLPEQPLGNIWCIGSPYCHCGKLSYKLLAQHLLAGYTVTDLTEFFLVNKEQSCTRKEINKVIHSLREYIKLNIKFQ